MNCFKFTTRDPLPQLSHPSKLTFVNFNLTDCRSHLANFVPRKIPLINSPKRNLFPLQSGAFRRLLLLVSELREGGDDGIPKTEQSLVQLKIGFVAGSGKVKSVARNLPQTHKLFLLFCLFLSLVGTIRSAKNILLPRYCRLLASRKTGTNKRPRREWGETKIAFLCYNNKQSHNFPITKYYI